VESYRFEPNVERLTDLHEYRTAARQARVWCVTVRTRDVRPALEHVFVSETPRRAAILHADLDAFYASVEQRDDPRLRNRPVVVGGGVVLAASYEAKRRGVKTAMSGRQARMLCPDVINVRPRFDAYVEASKAVFEVFRDTTPQVQGVSIDEAFLDVAGLHRIDVSPVQIAARLRERVRDEVGLPITVGVARTPFLAKVASRVAKPDGLLLVEPAGEDAFLHPLPLTMLWGVGEVTATKLGSYGLATAGDVAALGESVLVGLLGRAAGRHLFAVVHGRTPEQVVVGRRRGSIGAQRAIGHGPHDQEFVRAALLGLVDRVCRRMRTAHRTARTVVLRLRFEDYTRATRSHSFAHATSSGADIGAVATMLLAAAGGLVRERGLTLVGVALTNLESDAIVQPQLCFGPVDTSGMDTAVDAVAARFGNRAVQRASLLRSGDGFSAPMLED
jgi:DNA polymerase IV